MRELKVQGSSVHEVRFHRVDGIVSPQLLLAAGGVRWLAAAVIAQPQRMICRAVPDDVAHNLQIVVGARRRRHLQTGRRVERPMHRQVLPTAWVASRVDDQVVVDKDIAVRNRCGIAYLERTPPALGVTRLAACAVLVTRPAAMDDLQHVAARTDPIQRIVGKKNIVAAVDTKPRALSIVDEIVDDAHAIGLVVKPRRCHILETGALSSGKAAGPTIIDRVGLHVDIRRTALCICTPVVGAVNTIVANRSILHGDKIDGVFIAALNLAVLNGNVLGLVDLYCLVCVACPIQDSVVDSDMATLFAVKDIPLIGDDKATYLHIVDMRHIDIAGQSRGSCAVCRLDADGIVCCAMSILPVDRIVVGSIVARNKQNSITGARQ